MLSKFKYSNNEINSLENYITPDRLTSYMAHTGGDRLRAIKLYEYNVEVSAALYGPLQIFEVALRNSIHHTLAAHFGQSDWWNYGTPPLRHPQTQMLQKAVQKLTRKQKPHTPGRIIAELNFGFWTGLAGPQYAQHLWVPALHNAFPNVRLGHRTAHSALERLRDLRNRIAHHEPIFTRPLVADFQAIETVLSWICADTTAWMRHSSTFRALYLGEWQERMTARARIIFASSSRP